MKTLSLDSQVSAASLAKLWNEVEEAVGHSGDPLEILIAQEEEFDPDLAVRILEARHSKCK